MASKITIKRSLTAAAPAGLSFGEMAFVQGSGLTANQLYVGISGGNPAWVGAQIGTTGTWTDNSAQTSLATQYAIEQRITSKISASTTGVSSFNGVTGAVTGVSSFNGVTGAVSGVTTSVANTFTQLNTFSAGISTNGGTFGTPTQLVGTNITGTATAFTASNVTTNANLTGAITSVGNGTTLGSFSSAQLRNALTDDTGTGVAVFATSPTFTTSVIGGASMDVFNTTSTTVNGFGAATTMTLGATTGNAYVRNPVLTLGNTTNTINTNSGTANVLTIAPYGDLLLTAQSTSTLGGEFPSITINSTDNAAGNVNINGGDLRLSTKTDSTPTITPVNIIFEGATDNGHETTLTVTEPTIDRTITLPDATGTVALTQTSVASFNGATGAVTGVSSFNGLTGAVSGVTTSVANTFTAVNTFSAGISSNGGTFGTPTQLVGTNITGTASSFTAGNVTTNANLTGAITSVGNGTTLGSFTSAHLRNALTDETGTGVAVFGTDPAITTSLTTPSTSFDLLNTTATTVNFAGGASSALNIGNVGGTATFAGSVIVNGNFTVQGNTTTLNTTTLNVEDFNITMGLTLTNASQCTGAGIAIGVGTGITFAYDHSSLGWLSSVNMDLASGKVFKIANASVLSATTLGSLVVNSSLTSVGTLLDLTVTNTINGSVTGNAGTATTATNANNIAVALDSSDSTCFITFVNTSSGNQATKVNSTLTYNALSGELSATLIDGGTF